MIRRSRWLWKLAVAAVALVAAFALVEPSAWRVGFAHPEFLVPALAGWLAFSARRLPGPMDRAVLFTRLTRPPNRDG